MRIAPLGAVMVSLTPVQSYVPLVSSSRHDCCRHRLADQEQPLAVLAGLIGELQPHGRRAPVGRLDVLAHHAEGHRGLGALDGGQRRRSSIPRPG